MSTENAKKKPFHTRGFTTFSVTWVFLILLITGVVLYVAPKGRVAHWTGWSVLGLDKEQWGAVHMVAALALLIAAGFHLYFNWRIFLGYFTSKARSGMNLMREFMVATCLTVLVMAGTVAGIPPMKLVATWNEDIKDFWEAKSVALPYAHAEESTLAEFAEKTGVPAEKLEQTLKDRGFEVPNTTLTLKDLSALNGTSPSGLSSPRFLVQFL